MSEQKTREELRAQAKTTSTALNKVKQPKSICLQNILLLKYLRIDF